MRKIFSILALSTLTVGAYSQKISTTSTIVDLGQVQFYKPASGIFDLKNTGNKPLQISKVDTSCGCTLVSYPEKAIPAGEGFTIKVTYDARMMGHFDRVIEVYSNGSKKPLRLDLKGVVVEEVTDFKGNFPFKLGDLTADCNAIEFDDVRLGEVFQEKFHVYNPTGKVVKPQILHLPSYLKAEVSPTNVAPNRSAEITVTLDSRQMRDYGLTQTQIYLGANPGEKVSPSKAIDVALVLLPPIQEMTLNQLENAPKMKISSTQLSMPITDGKKKSETIEITNTGYSRLEIQSIQMYTTGLEIKLNKNALMPGETAKLKVTTIPKELKNLKTRPRILMITNDPDQPKVVVYVNVD